MIYLVHAGLQWDKWALMMAPVSSPWTTGCPSQSPVTQTPPMSLCHGQGPLHFGCFLDHMNNIRLLLDPFVCHGAHEISSGLPAYTQQNTQWQDLLPLRPQRGSRESIPSTLQMCSFSQSQRCWQLPSLFASLGGLPCHRPEIVKGSLCFICSPDNQSLR